MNIPEELTSRRQWHCWQNSNGTKIPVQVNGIPAKSNVSDTWTDFETACDNAFRFSGLAFEITEPYTGIDLDNCIDDHGELRDWAKPIVERLTPVAYGEISPSGTGIKFLTMARKPEGCRSVFRVPTSEPSKQQLECYDNRRFWTITDDVWGAATSIHDGQDVINWLCFEYLSQKDPVAVPTYEPAPLTGSSLLDRARAYVDNAEPGRPGDRNNAAFRLSGHLRTIDNLGERLPESPYPMSKLNLFLSIRV